MGIGVLVLGHSGSGKSTSMRNCTPDRFGVINVQGKPLPFKTELKTFNSDNYEDIRKVLNASKAPSIVIDDSQYLMSHEFMYRANEKGYDKYSHIGTNFFHLLETIRLLPDDKIVYLMHHIETDDLGREKAKTVGKMVDNYIVVEGCFSIVLKAVADNKGYYFRTKTNGNDCVKTPIGMFNDEQIDNDLLAVDDAIREFYGLGKETKDGKQTK
jgi:hypothetical protein